MKRACGVLLPLSSIPSPYGIGTFSKEAYEFVDKLEAASQSYWQMLPLGPTSYGDSPYQSLSAFAGNSYFIDLEEFIEEGLLNREEVEAIDWGDNSSYVDYSKIYEGREYILKKAYENFKLGLDKEAVLKFREEISELYEETKTYCLYKAIKSKEGGKSWDLWEKELMLGRSEALEEVKIKLSDDIEFYAWQQIVFHKQWARLKAYANDKGIEIIGDMPIYVAFDSAEAWSKPELFMFNEDHEPEFVAGCPPDYFSEEGQLWGNPL